jgi:hypothetical protein
MVKGSAGYQKKVNTTRTSLLALERLEVKQLVDDHEASVQEWRKNAQSHDPHSTIAFAPQTAFEDEDEDNNEEEDEEHPLYIEYMPINATQLEHSQSPSTSPLPGIAKPSLGDLLAPFKWEPKSPS